MENLFDDTKIPVSFGLCAASDCSRSATCLRHLAFVYAPADYTFLPTLNPNRIKAMGQEACNYFRSTQKLRYAKGFMRMLNRLTVVEAEQFRTRLILCYGRKGYYQRRKGEKLMSPGEQTYFIQMANKIGIQCEEYFDAFVEEYNWK